MADNLAVALVLVQYLLAAAILYLAVVTLCKVHVKQSVLHLLLDLLHHLVLLLLHRHHRRLHHLLLQAGVLQPAVLLLAKHFVIVLATPLLAQLVPLHVATVM